MASSSQNISTELGFAEEADKWVLTNRYFPSKIGGFPSFLELQNIPDSASLVCDYCSEPCIFLCQIYAGSQNVTHAFHRTIFVFICKNGKCCSENLSGNIKVFRSQLPRKNAFYSYDPPDESKEDDEIASPVKLCHVCGNRGPLVCSKCRKISYCAASHQKFDWKTHKQSCGKADDVKVQINELLFPELEIVIEPEEMDDSADKRESEKEADKRRLREYEEMVKSGKAGEVSDADLNEFAETKEDKVFGKFKKITEFNPEQILRYSRNGTPLWISEHAILNTSNVPNCQNCNGKRTFEFQIMPQLLTILKNYELDWGVIAIFTCKNDCDVNGKYVAEFCYKQDIGKSEDDESEIDIEKLRLNAMNSQQSDSEEDQNIQESGPSKEVKNGTSNIKQAKESSNKKKKSSKPKPKEVFKATDDWE